VRQLVIKVLTVVLINIYMVKKTHKNKKKQEFCHFNRTKHFHDKKKPFLYRALGLKEVEAARTSRPSAHVGGRIVRHMHQPPLPPGDTPCTHLF